MSVRSVERDSPRIERAFLTHFHRSDPLPPATTPPPAPTEKTAAVSAAEGLWAWDVGVSEPVPGGGAGPSKHEYEVVVAHGNVIRYMVCRALQLPPSAAPQTPTTQARPKPDPAMSLPAPLRPVRC